MGIYSSNIGHFRSVSFDVLNSGRYIIVWSVLIEGRSMSVKVFVAFCTLLVGTYAFPSNVKGIQIKNNGKDKLWMVMTGEESFVLPAGQMVSLL